MTLGDYEIRGNVTVRRQLHADNIFGASETFNVRQLHAEGLATTETLIDTHIDFVQPIRADSLSTLRLGSIDATKLVRMRSDDEIQVITGTKYFLQDLHTTAADVMLLNNVDLNVLNETTLKKSGDQELRGNIAFKKITVNR